MDETPDPDAGKTRAEMIAELRRMKAVLTKVHAEKARHGRRVRALERELEALERERDQDNSEGNR